MPDERSTISSTARFCVRVTLAAGSVFWAFRVDMGNACGADSPEGKQARTTSTQIEEELKKSKKASETKVKILLLGTGDAGKSTFAKQMTVLHSSGFSNEEYQRFQKVLRDNCLTSMQKVLAAVHERQVKLDKELSGPSDAVLAAGDLTPAVAGAPRPFHP